MMLNAALALWVATKRSMAVNLLLFAQNDLECSVYIAHSLTEESEN